MEQNLDSKRLDRRTLLVGGASAAAGAVLVGTGEAEASDAAAAWTPGVVAGAPSGGSVAVKELPLASKRLVHVDLAPETIVHADLSAGETILVEGAAGRHRGTISARRVIRAVIGRRSDAER